MEPYLSGTFITCQHGANSHLFRVFSFFCPMHQNFVRRVGGMCLLFEICEKRAFRKCMGWRVVTFLSTRSARKHALNISHLLIPNRRLHRLFQAGLGPHLGRRHHASCWEHIFSAFANPAACGCSLVPTLNSEAWPRDHLLWGRHSVALSASPCATQWTHCTLLSSTQNQDEGKGCPHRGWYQSLVVPNQIRLFIQHVV